jgi:hypothetical protein
LSFRQWLLLVISVGVGYGCMKALHVPFKLAVSLGVFSVGLPATLAYLSGGDGLPVSRLVLDAVIWLAARGVFLPGGDPGSRRPPVVRVRAFGDAHRPLDEAHRDDGLLDRLLSDERWDS